VLLCFFLISLFNFNEFDSQISEFLLNKFHNTQLPSIIFCYYNRIKETIYIIISFISFEIRFESEISCTWDLGLNYKIFDIYDAVDEIEFLSLFTRPGCYNLITDNLPWIIDASTIKCWELSSAQAFIIKNDNIPILEGFMYIFQVFNW
jgi:hypothetical protein